MSNITERLKDAVNQFPAIEEHPRKLFVDSLAEIERLQVRVAELESFINQAPVETGCVCAARKCIGIAASQIIRPWIAGITSVI
jgi:hypothetical protein